MAATIVVEKIEFTDKTGRKVICKVQEIQVTKEGTLLFVPQNRKYQHYRLTANDVKILNQMA